MPDERIQELRRELLADGVDVVQVAMELLGDTGVVAESREWVIVHSDGRRSAGGNPPRFTARGKTWHRRGDLVSHMRNLSRGADVPDIYRDCKVVEILKLTVPMGATPVHAWSVAARKARDEAHEKKLARAEARRTTAAEEAERAAYERLKAKYEARP